MRPGVESDLREARRRLAELSALEEVLGLLGWDQEVMMPSGAALARGRQVATVALVHHQRLVDPEHGALLSRLADADLEPIDAANVALARRDHLRATRVPADLVERWSEATVAGVEVWVRAREAGDFSAFAPALAELVDLARARARAIDPDRPAYEVLVDEHEPGITVAELDRHFAALGRFCAPAIAAVREAPRLEHDPRLTEPVPADRQEAIARELMALLGFDRSRGRLDRAVHPFCGGAGPSDVRITARYAERDLLDGLLAVIHETGHALYELGRDLDRAAEPVSRPRSAGWHESQSLFYERQVAGSPEFCGFLAAWLGERLPHLRGLSGDDLRRALARVDPDNQIRTAADPLTYPMHVILRHDLEKGLLGGTLAARDLPTAWNEGARRLLGAAPKDDREGVLQDIHWSSGAFGYFPSYVLGAMLAAQLHQAALRALPALPAALARGETAELRAWLGREIHVQGSRLPSDALCRRATGAPLGPEALCADLGARLRFAYGIEVSA
ncbi:MAG: carboxypeptidase M32 [Nannocystaceae bacterium]